MVLNWRGWARIADDAVDDTFGDRVNIIPWDKAGGLGGGGPDLSREQSGEVVGVFVNPAATVRDVFAGIRVEQDLQLSVRADLIPVGTIAGDRVIFLDRDNIQLEVSFVEPGATYRSLMHLLIIRDAVQ